MKPGELVITGTVVKCGNCSATLGEVVRLKDLELIRIGGVNMRSVTGFCIRCNHEFHWYVTDKYIQKLIALAGGI